MADRLGESQWGDNVSARFPDPGNPGILAGDNPVEPNRRLLKLSRPVPVLDRRFQSSLKAELTLEYLKVNVLGYVRV